MRHGIYLRTPRLVRVSRSRQPWRLEFGYTAIYCDSISEAREIASRLRWRLRTGMRPAFAGYRV